MEGGRAQVSGRPARSWVKKPLSCAGHPPRPDGATLGRMLDMSDEASPASPLGPLGPVGALGPDHLGAWGARLGMEFSEVSGDRVACSWEAGPETHQPYGIVHGGAHCTVVETLASMGAASWVSETGAKVVGVNNNTDFLQGRGEGRMLSVATPLHRGRSQQLWLVETTAENDGRLVARGQVRLQNLHPRD